jgi:hypothetical protein
MVQDLLDQCYDSKNIFAKKLSFFVQNTASFFCIQNMAQNIGFKGKGRIFRHKLAKIAKKL